MKILFTGASSFTGYWFVDLLAKLGHDVVATFTRAAGTYEGLRGRRVRKVCAAATPAEECTFGEERFLELVESDEWDVLCHHAAHVENYRSPDFGVAKAYDANTKNLRTVLEALRDRGCTRVVLTGTVFESGEGEGGNDQDELLAFSPYGLSKTLTAETFRYYCSVAEMRLGKFVVPNPFGPFEEPRFTTYLAKTWRSGETPIVATPAYVRDNIHVSLLARAYARFVEELGDAPGFERTSPSGYRETQGEFAQRFARELEPRLGLPCPLELAEQVTFEEPRVRVNTEPADGPTLGWDELGAWDELAAYYQENYL